MEAPLFAMEQGGAPEHMQRLDDIIVWGNTAEEVFEKGKNKKSKSFWKLVLP